MNKFLNQLFFSASMKYPNYQAAEIEKEILDFWHNKKIVEKLRERNKKGKKFYFLQGPPYTSGAIHLGHAWNMALKDIVLRYKRMNGLKVWDRMGYDMHGLPTSQKTMAKLGLKNKDDIEKFGLGKFTKECAKFCIEKMQQMDKDFIRLGATLDFTDSYQPIQQKFMESEWWLIKQAYEKGRLYQGLRTMHWDFATQTGVAKHELEYKSIKDISIYVKFRSADDPNKFFLVWTTTPWTIPLNLAIMTNPKMDYLEIKVCEETWVVAEELLDSVIEKAKLTKNDYTIIKKVKGKKLEGLRYEHPLGIKKHLPEELQDNPKLFTILTSDQHVDASAGTGLVHCAPGCGPEDYEVGHKNGIPPFNCVNEEGKFEDFGPFTDLRAKLDDVEFIKAIHSAGALVAKEKYVHDYPHGERSDQPVIFRTTKQWFFKVEDLKDKMLAANKKIDWNPASAKNAFNSWLENLRDNSITKQRYWGTPVPIWQYTDKNGKEEHIVIGSVAELEKLSGQKVTDMHIPKIDEITIKKGKKIFKRIPDVLNVWIDAGTTSWNCLNYPQEKASFKEMFPADFICEGKDQIRGWFNLLMVSSFLALGKPSFKSVYMNGFVTDVDGVKMSKSLGNIISPYELIDKHSADVLRYYLCQNNAGQDLNFSWDEAQVKARNITIFWNVHKLLINLVKDNNISVKELIDKKEINKLNKIERPEEKYILSRLNSTIKTVTELMESYKLDEIITPIEDLMLELSRTYIQIIRDKSVLGSDDEKKLCVQTIAKVLVENLKMFQLVCPFVSEAIYQNLKEVFMFEEESITHCLWPKFNQKIINSRLEENFVHLSSVIQASLAAREKARIGLRWPVKEIVIITKDKKVSVAIEKLKDILKKQVNVKEVLILESLPGVKEKVKANYSKLGPVFGKDTPKIIASLNESGSEKILTQIEKEGSFNLKIEGKKIEIKIEMFDVEREVPEMFKEAEFKGGKAYLNTDRNEELENEGFAREVMRKIQSLRKDAGLEKTDSIILHVQCSKEMVDRLNNYKKEISEKVGAQKMIINFVNAAKKHQQKADFKIRSEKFVVNFDKL